jgi:hypothetical protein
MDLLSFFYYDPFFKFLKFTEQTKSPQKKHYYYLLKAPNYVLQTEQELKVINF